MIDATSDATSHDNKISNSNITGNLCAFVTGRESIGISMLNQSYGNIIENCEIFGQAHGPTFGIVPPPVTVPVTYGIKINNSPANEILQNKIGYNGIFGIYDSTIPPVILPPLLPPTSISTSFFTNNTCLFQETNYWVTLPTPVTFTPGVDIYLHNVTTIYAGNTSAYIPTLPVLQNISVQSY